MVDNSADLTHLEHQINDIWPKLEAREREERAKGAEKKDEERAAEKTDS
jgi:hypothetical protein